MIFGWLGSTFGRMGISPGKPGGGALPPPPAGFAYVANEGKFVLNEGKYVIDKVA